LSRKTLPLFAWIGVFIAAGGVFLFARPVTVLTFRNASVGSSFYFNIDPSERITLFYTNSIYGAPVEEVFEVLNGDFVLKAVKTDTPAVMEYYGFEDSGPEQAMQRSLGPTFLILTSMRQDQGLRIGGRSLDLHALAAPGDRILVRVDRVSQARSWWWRLLQKETRNTSGKP
jgi:hypothetical protein